MEPEQHRGWKNFNKEMNTGEEELRKKEYPDLEKEVIEIMKKTVGKTKITTKNPSQTTQNKGSQVDQKRKESVIPKKN